MSDCLDDNAVSAFVDEALAAEARAHVQAHLEDCERCSTLVTDLVRTFALAPAHAADEIDESLPPFLAVGTSIGRYLVVGLVGVGGMGIVYLGYDPELDRRVALKLVRSDRGDVSPAAHDRLVTEAQAQARLSDPHVVAVYDVGRWAGSVFVAMEHIDGTSLATWLEDPQLSWRDVVRAFVAAGRGLASAHRAGLVHGDFKPANVLRGKDGRILIGDFGLAQPTNAASTRGGTPAYVAPEQLAGRAIDTRADQYSFAIALTEALVGRRGPAQRAHGPDRQPPTWVLRALAPALERDPARRYATMEPLLAALERDPRARRLRSIAIGVPLALVALVVGSALWQRHHRAATCDAEGAAIGARWGAAQHDAFTRSFRATGLAYANDVVQRVIAGLDHWTNTWRDARASACRATMVDRVQASSVLALRRACYDEAQASLDSLVTRFSNIERTGVAQSLDAVELLPEIASCSDVESLRARQSLDPRDLAQRRILADATTQIIAGKLTDGLVAASAVLASASSARVRSDALELTAKIHTLRNERPAAAHDLRDAIWTSWGAGDDRAMLDECTLLGSALLDTEGAAAAKPWLACVDAGLQRLGNPAVARAAATQLRAGIANAEDRTDDARALRLRQIAEIEAVNGKDSARLWVPLQNLASTLETSGHIEESLPYARRALALARKLWGEEHPKVGSSHGVLGAILEQRGDHAAATVELERALAILRPEMGPDSTEILSIELDLANAHSETDQLERARAEYHDVWQGRFRLLGPEHPETIGVFVNMGLLDTQRKDWPHATETLEQAVAVIRNHPRWPAMLRATALQGLGEARLEGGSPRLAIAPLVEAAKIFAAAAVPVDFAATLMLNARAEQKLGHLPAARALATRARSEAAKEDGPAAEKQRHEADVFLASKGP